MAENILYLLGAGASAEALPLARSVQTGEKYIKSLAQSMLEMAHYLITNQILFKNGFPALGGLYDATIENLKKLALQGDKFQTVDTYMKYLYIYNKAEYENLKFTISIYFTLEQLVHKKIDERYLVWLTSLLDSEMRFPSNVKILSWNYDFQIQLTADIFRRESLVNQHGVDMYSFPLIDYYPSVEPAYDIFKTSLLHLNGIAGFIENRHAFIGRNDNPTLYDCFNYFNKKDIKNNLHFAWEENRDEKVRGALISMLDNITILVVIGYSFPFFNRKMDELIFQLARRTHANQLPLKKIYFQDPVKDGKFLYNQFNLHGSFPILHIPQTDALYIPFEL